MPDIENLLREELKSAAQKIQPEVLRPLRVLAPRRGWRPRLLPLAAAAAVIAIIAVVALVTGLPASHQPATSRSVPAVPPRFYVTIRDVPDGQGEKVEAVVRASASGQVTGTVTVPSFRVDDETFVTAAADDRSFIVSTYDGQAPSNLGGGLDVRLFRFGISAEGKPGHLTELAVAPVRSESTQGIALSPNGKLLAVSLTREPLGPNYIGALEVINLATGATRTWSAPAGRTQYYVPGPPSWAEGNRMVAFTWLRTSEGGISSVTEGVRLLDTAAPGDNLADAKLIVPSGVAAGGSIESALALITPDGRDVIVTTLRDLTPEADHHTVIVRFAELQAGTGRLVRVLRTQTVRYDQGNFISLPDDLGVLSLGSGGRYALVQGSQFGWLDVGGPDPGRFTPLPALPAGQYVAFAAW
jgi:hypothetical protein